MFYMHALLALMCICAVSVGAYTVIGGGDEPGDSLAGLALLICAGPFAYYFATQALSLY
jgi:hypothetical protein